MSVHERHGAAGSWDVPLTVALSLSIVGALGLTVAWALGGHFSYTHDDPYIHLAVAENLLRGQYGVNVEEPSSPSSSILFPFLLVPFVALRFGQFGPLVINSLACAGSIVIMLRLVYGDDRLIPPPFRAAAVALVIALAATLNLFGLVFTGMEHSLHVLTSLLVLYGLIRTLESGTVPPYLIAALIVNPLVRFEGLALTAGALAALWLAGHRRTVLVTGATVVLSIGGFMAWLVSMGLAPLPSSVLEKSRTMSATIDERSTWSIARSLYHNAVFSLQHAGGIYITILGVIFGFSIISKIKYGYKNVLRENSLIIICIIPAIIGHLFLGRYDFFT